MAQCGSAGIHAGCPPDQHQDSASTRVAIGGVCTDRAKKLVSANKNEFKAKYALILQTQKSRAR
ncbi:hypothetical protein PSFL111601_00970 [Pseudomonas floridensis]